MSNINTNRLIFTPVFKNLISERPLVLVDGGARDNLVSPWELIESCGCLNTIGFEPDLEECDRLNRLGKPARTYHPKALWNIDGEVGVHIAHSPGSSSVYPPNQSVLRQFDRGCWEPRCTDRYVTVQSAKIDSVLEASNSDCDFLKLDVHSAEYETLEGAIASLKSKVFGVLVETWTLEYHTGQYLAHDVMKLLIDLGFNLFEVGLAAGGRRSITNQVNLYGKQQVHGLDLLFFKDPVVFPCTQAGFVKSVKAAAIADIYGYPDYAIDILKNYGEQCSEYRSAIQQLAQIIINTSQHPQSTGFASLH
jgi:FkbM family methyltransferase